jgi:hypothetical protein
MNETDGESPDRPVEESPSLQAETFDDHVRGQEDGNHGDRNQGGRNHGDRDRWDRRKFPTSVACDKLIKTITTRIVTSTARRTTITRFAKTPTSWTTITSTHTSKVDAPPRTTTTQSVTITATITAAIPEYTTITGTSTSTVYVAEATEYPGCKADNFLISRDGQNIYTWSFYGIQGSVGQTSSDEECCQRSVCLYVVKSIPD